MMGPLASGIHVSDLTRLPCASLHTLRLGGPESLSRHSPFLPSGTGGGPTPCTSRHFHTTYTDVTCPTHTSTDSRYPPTDLHHSHTSDCLWGDLSLPLDPPQGHVDRTSPKPDSYVPSPRPRLAPGSLVGPAPALPGHHTSGLVVSTPFCTVLGTPPVHAP